MWHVQRIYPQPASPAQLLCMGDEAATTVELYDDTTRKTDTIVICWSTLAGHECANLHELTVAGYVPNDWDDACA